MFSFLLVHVRDKTGSLPVSFPVQIIYRIISYLAAKAEATKAGPQHFWAEPDFCLSEQLFSKSEQNCYKATLAIDRNAAIIKWY